MAGRARPAMRLAAGCERYLERIKSEGQADRTVYTTHYALARFRRAVGTRRDPDPYLHLITDAVMDDYCFGPNGIRRGIGAVSFNRYRSVLKTFFDYCLLMRWVDINPMDGIGRARPDAQKSRLLLNAGELLRLLDHCTNPVERIACAIGMNTGLRGNDVKHLTIFDANLAGGALQTEIRKTKKLDVKPITTELHFELSSWLHKYAELMELELTDLQDDWLLVPAYWMVKRGVDQYGLKLRPTDKYAQPWNLVQHPLERMGFPTKGEGFHTLRRSSARALFESLRDQGEGRDHALMIVKEFLNHTNTAQTEQYLGLSHERTIRDTLLKDKPFLSALAQTERQRVAEQGVA